MRTREITDGQISRRDLLRRAGLSGLTLATVGAFGPTLTARAADAGADSPEGFLAYAYAQRARSMTTGDTSLLDALYDPASTALLSFEKSRAKFFNVGLLAIWDNSTLVNYSSTVALTSLQLEGSEATAKLYEKIIMEWVPSGVPDSPARQQVRQRYPEKFEQLIAVGTRGELTSTMGVRHDVTLTQGLSGWRLVKDAYGEPLMYGVSPDLPPGSGEGGGGPLQGEASPSPSVTTASPSTCILYSPSNAVNYALAHCAGGTYDPNYCDYCYGSCTCNGDCTNFVSQCLNAGGEPSDKTWYALGGTCPCSCASSKFVGSTAWINCTALHNWVLGQGRGTDQSSVDNLGNGDFITYSYCGSACFHAAVFTGAPYNNVSCHCNDLCNVDWKLGYGSGVCHTFTSMNIDISC